MHIKYYCEKNPNRQNRIRTKTSMIPMTPITPITTKTTKTPMIYQIDNKELAWHYNFKEEFYQKILEPILGGTHMRLETGITDITTDRLHAEIKVWKEYRAGISQLQLYNAAEKRENLQLHLFGIPTTKERQNVLIYTKMLNIEPFELIHDMMDVHVIALRTGHTIAIKKNAIDIIGYGTIQKNIKTQQNSFLNHVLPTENQILKKKTNNKKPHIIDEPSNKQIIPNQAMQCHFCKKEFISRSGKSLHMKYSCKQNPDRQKRESVKQCTQPICELIKSPPNVINNKYTNLNSVGKETLDHIKPEFLSECVNKKYLGILNLVEIIYCNPEVPENQNIRKKNEKKSWVETFDSGIWIVRDKNTVLDDLISMCHKILFDHYMKNMTSMTAYDEFIFSLMARKSESYYRLRRNVYLRIISDNKTFVKTEIL
jgi:hypothetical protein